MRFFLVGLMAICAPLVSVGVAGCGDSAPTLPPDAERDPSLPGHGGAGGDDPIDGSTGGTAGGGGAGGSSGGGSWCETSELCPSCPDLDALCDESTPCSTGEVCLPTGCEDLSRCFAIGGGACDEDGDCGDPAYACNLEIRRCLRAEPGCDDSNDCVAGFACEDGGSCVDRRLPCSDDDACPHGYTCFFASRDQRFCRRITRPCGDDFDCLVLGVLCGDADGDGAKECMPSLMPNSPDAVSCELTQCADVDAPVCETTPEGTRASCGRYGPCRSSAQCASGFECRDLWGDGRAECVSGPGSCVDSRACGLQSLCASPRGGGEPRCIAPAPM